MIPLVLTEKRWKPKPVPKARKHGEPKPVPKGTVALSMGLHKITAQALALCTPAVQLYESREAARRHVSAASERRSADIRGPPAVYETLNCEDESEEDMSGVESNDSRCASERRRRMRSADSRARELGRRSVSRAQR